MKIKFLRPFRLYNPIGDDMMMDEGSIENMEKEDYAKWLIDNGFAEEVNKSGWWKPESYEKYYFLSNVGEVIDEAWLGAGVDEFRYSVGNCFKTKKAAERYWGYLKAIATVRQDEGVLTPMQINGLIKNEDLAYYVGYMGNRGNGEVLCGCTMSFEDCWMPVGAILFDSEVHADRSLRNHPDEWKTIVNYDWSQE